MSDMNFGSKPSRDDRWEARKRAMFSQENSFENPAEGARPLGFSNQPPMFEPPNQMGFNNYPEPPMEVPYQSIPNEYVNREPMVSNSNPNFNIPKNNYSPQQSMDMRKQPEVQMVRGRTPPSNSFFLNPASDSELRRQQMQEEYRSYAAQDINRRKEENPAPAVNPRGRGTVDQQQSEDFKKKMYNMELKRQIDERENNKKNQRQPDRVEEYFPFGRPGAGAPNRDSSGRIIAARPPKFNENDPNFNKPGVYRPPQGASKANQEVYEPYPPQHDQYPPQYAPQHYAPPPQYPPPQYAPPNRDHSPYPPQYPPSQYPPQYPPQQYEPKESYSQNNYANPPPPPISDERQFSDPAKDYAKSADDAKKFELQRALQVQIEEKQRKKEEEKRRKLMEERYEEERLMKERQELDAEFRREAEKKKKQINELQSFNNNNGVVVVEPARKGRRPRTPVELPPPEPQPSRINEDSRKRGQSAVSRSPVFTNPGQNSNPHEIPQEYINYLNSALEKKIGEFKNEYKVQEMRQQEEIFKLRTKNQINSEQNLDAQREIDRLKDELRRKQIEEDIRHKELAIALANTRNIVPANTRLPPYEPRPLLLTKSNNDAALSLDFASRSLISESKFIPLPSPPELFPAKPPSPKEKKAMRLDTIFPSLPESNSNYDTYKSAGSSLGIDNILKKNEERLKALDKFDPDTQDELNKLDDILFKFADIDKKTSENVYERRGYEPPRRIQTPALLARGEYLPSIKELDGEATYSLPEYDKNTGFNVY